ncbi:MAG: helix-turn-helix domain-containing protein [Saccharofermentanales bacterium]
MFKNKANKLGLLIKTKRKENNIKQKELAQMLNIPLSTFSNYENGKRNMGIDTLRKISEVLDIEFNLLLRLRQEDSTYQEIEEYIEENIEFDPEIEDAILSEMAEEFSTIKAAETEFDILRSEVIVKVIQLNNEGLLKADGYISDLLKLAEYRSNESGEFKRYKK